MSDLRAPSATSERLKDRSLMTYSLADLPLEFRPRKLAMTMVFALIIVLELAFAVSFELIAKWPLEAFYTRGLINSLSFLFMVGACVWGIVDVQRKTDRLVIDQTGVELELNGVRRAWAWTEMARFHLVLVHPRSKLHMVAIEPKGQGTFDAKANVIWPRFGPGTDEFLAILRAGKARWGEA
jgi:hypothetical protein